MLFSVETVACLLMKLSEEIQALKVLFQVLRLEGGHFGKLPVEFFGADLDFLSEILGSHIILIDRKLEISSEIPKIKTNPQAQYLKEGKGSFFPEFFR